MFCWLWLLFLWSGGGSRNDGDGNDGGEGLYQNMVFRMSRKRGGPAGGKRGRMNGPPRRCQKGMAGPDGRVSHRPSLKSW